MIFICLSKVRKKLTKEAIAEVSKAMEKWGEEGVKFLNIYYTLGRYDIVAIFDAPDENVAMRGLMRLGDIEATETLVAISREKATKLIE